jgi:DNA primase
MACHLAGVPTAVATCGTAFGDDHARVLRRVLLDQDAFHGEVIFTFDGDEAGRRAAVKAFSGDQQFVAQTYVAVEARGMDPCDLRLADGDAAVRELVASRIPLYRFVLDNTLTRYDLDRGDQRVDAVREAMSLTKAIRDKSKVEEFLREVATKVGLDLDQVRTEYRRFKEPARTAQAPSPSVPAAPASGPSSALANFGGPAFADERETLKALIQFPQLATEFVDDLDDNDFTHPVALELWRTMSRLAFPQTPDTSWVARIDDALESDDAKRILSIAAVQPLLAAEKSTAAVVSATIVQLQARTLSRHISDLKSKLQRTNPVEQPELYNRMFGELIALEEQHRSLRDRAIGA